MGTCFPRSIIFALVVMLCSIPPAHALWNGETERWKTQLFVSGQVGWNSLQQGYPGYTNNLYVGGSLYYFPPYESNIGFLSAWKEKVMYRCSFEYFPLIVPDGVYNTTEDLVSVNVDMLYPVWDGDRIDFFGGLGLGLYVDSIRLDTPATGNRSCNYFYAGLKPSIGASILLRKNLELVPELRTHFVYEVNGYFATHTTFCIGLLYKFR